MAFISVSAPSLGTLSTFNGALRICSSGGSFTCHPVVHRRARSCYNRGQRTTASADGASSSTESVGEGSRAPSFGSVPISGGDSLSSDDLGGLYIIYFYPRDATSGCTCEAVDFTTMLPDLQAVGAKIVGVSRDSVESHDQFVKDSSIGFPLIADVDGHVSDAYGTYKLRNVFGKEMMMIERSTFIIKDGVIVKAWRGIKADGHAKQVVSALRDL